MVRWLGAGKIFLLLKVPHFHLIKQKKGFPIGRGKIGKAYKRQSRVQVRSFQERLLSLKYRTGGKKKIRNTFMESV